MPAGAILAQPQQLHHLGLGGVQESQQFGHVYRELPVIVIGVAQDVARATVDSGGILRCIQAHRCLDRQTGQGRYDQAFQPGLAGVGRGHNDSSLRLKLDQ